MSANGGECEAIGRREIERSLSGEYDGFWVVVVSGIVIRFGQVDMVEKAKAAV